MPPKKDTTTKKRYSWNNTREPRIPKEIKSQGLDAINRWITYNRLAKADLIGIIMEREDKDKKRKKGDDSDDETDDESAERFAGPTGAYQPSVSSKFRKIRL